MNRIDNYAAQSQISEKKYTSMENFFFHRPFSTL